MGANRAHLCGLQLCGKHTHHHFHGGYRHRLTSHDARWFTSPALSRLCHLWSDIPPLETGLVTVLVNRVYPGLLM